MRPQQRPEFIAFELQRFEVIAVLQHPDDWHIAAIEVDGRFLQPPRREAFDTRDAALAEVRARVEQYIA